MAIKIIDPPRPGKLFVTINRRGYAFFSSRLAFEAGITDNTRVLVGLEDGKIFFKKTSAEDLQGFNVVRNGRTLYCFKINLANLLRCGGFKLNKTQRFAVHYAKEDFYEIEGIKLN